MSKLDEIRAQYPGAYDDMSDSQLADALYQKHYSDMPREEFNAKMGTDFQAQQQMSEMTQRPGPAIAEQRRQQDVAQYEALPGWKKPIVAASDILQTGARFPAAMLTRAASYVSPGPYKPISPEDVIARLRTGQAEGPAFEAEVAKQKRQTEAAANRSGWAGTAGEVLATAGLPIAKLSAGKPLLNLAATSAGYGALSEDDPLKGAATGLAGGTAGYYGGKLISKAAETGLGWLGKALPVGPLKVPPMPKVMTKEDFNALAKQKFAEAESHNVFFNKDGLTHLHDQIETKLRDKGYAPENQPGLVATFRVLNDYIKTGAATQRGIQTLREITSGGYVRDNPKNNMMVAEAIDAIDDLGTKMDKRFIATTSPNPKAAGVAAKAARDAYRKGARLKDVEDYIESGRLQGETNISKNVRQSIRKKLKTIIDPRTPWKGRGYTPVQRAAIKKAITTSTTQDVLHSLSGLMPRDKLSAAVMATEGLTHAALAGSTGGASLLYTLPVTAARLGIGAAAERVANRLAKKSVDELVFTISTGQTSRQAAQSILQKLTASKRQAVMQGLGRIGFGAGVVAAQPLNEAYRQNEQ